MNISDDDILRVYKNISDADMLRVLERMREHRDEIISGEMALTDFEVDVIITGLELAGGV